MLLLIFFFPRYSKGYIFPIENLKKIGLPIKPSSLKDFLNSSCEQFRKKLTKEYDISLMINILLIFCKIILIITRCFIVRHSSSLLIIVFKKISNNIL